MGGIALRKRGTPRYEESKRVWRIFKLTTMVVNRPNYWKRSALALEFEVSERAIDRDLAFLSNLGYNVAHSATGYAFTHTPALPSVTLTMPEVLALTLAAGLARDSAEIDPVSLNAALAQLEGVLPATVLTLTRRTLMRHGQQTRDAGRQRAVLEAVQHAWLQRRQLRIVYATATRGGAISERVIEPYHLQRHYGRFWLVIAYDHRRQELRDFKLSRIQTAILLDKRYTIPDDFDVTRYRGDNWGVLRGEGGDPIDVTLLFSPQAGRWVQEEDSEVPMTFEPRPDGSVLAQLRTRVTPEMLRWLLWFGPDCRVLVPESLRIQLHALAEATCRHYTESEPAVSTPTNHDTS